MLNQFHEILENEYISIKKGDKKGNAFPKLIKNNANLREYLYTGSIDLISYYINPSDIHRLKFMFEGGEIHFCECGKPLSWRNFTKGYNKSCGDKKCSSRVNVASVKKYYMETFGETHLFKPDKFKCDLKEIFLKKYGVDNPGKSDVIKEKIKNTNLERFGETSWLKVKKNTDHIFNIISNKKALDRNERIINADIPITIKLYNNKNITINCGICKEDTTASTSYITKKIAAKENPCLICNPPLKSISHAENELAEFIKSIYPGEIIRNDRKIADGKEIDIYLPELKIAFEFDGTYWHSEIFKNKYDAINKKEFIISKGIDIYNIQEDNWCYKKEITKSRISNAIGKSDKIFARKCTICEIDSKLERDFLINNHIQGYVPSKVKIGLFYNNELVSLMTFGSKRKALGNIPKTNEYELLRFCNRLGNSVVGGASKLFKNFLLKYDPLEVISYQDNSWSTGNLYSQIGFALVGKTEPNYYWCKGNIRYHRYNFRKDKLISEGEDPNKTESQIMTERKYYKTWDLGNLKWIHKKKL